MDEEGFAALRRRMVETIGAHVLVAREELGKPSLDHRVLEAMAKVPRHEFVPLEMLTPTPTRRCRSASKKRSLNPSWLRS